MAVDKDKFVENYNSLLRQLEKDKESVSINIGTVIRFCSLFWSDDVELFKEFDLISRSSSNSATGEFSYENIDRVINLFAKHYELDPQTEMEKVMYLFIQNAINNGISYHLGSSANFDSIMELGLGIEAIGLKTEERVDWERLKNMDSGSSGPLITFRSEHEKNLWYSNRPILSARYGKMPEWLMELKLNQRSISTNDVRLKQLVDNILAKYDAKYKDTHRMLFLIPFQKGPVTSDMVAEMLNAGMTCRNVIGYFWGILENKNENTSSHIASSDILAVNLDDYSMWRRDEYGNIVKVVDGKKGNNFNK